MKKTGPSLSSLQTKADYKKILLDTQRLLDFSLDVICSIDQEGRFIMVSAAAKCLWGYDPAELIGKMYVEMVIEEDRVKTNKAAADIINGVNMTNFDNRYRCKDGSIIPIVWSARWNSKEKIMYCVAKDAREKVKIENELQRNKKELLDTVKELKQKNQRLKQLDDFIFLADMIPQIIWTSKPDGNLDYYNQHWYEYTGLNFEQTKDWGWKPVLHPDDVQVCIDRWTHCITTGEDYEVEYRFKKAADGSYRWHLGRAIPMRDENENIIKWFGTCTDIHDQKIMQEQLEKSNAELTQFRNDAIQELQKKGQFLNGVLKNLPVIVYRIDESGIITNSMGAGLKLIGLKEGAGVGHSAYTDNPELVEKIRKFRSGESNSHETKKEYNGNEIFYQVYLFADEVNPQAILGFALDITEKKKAEKVLSEAKLYAENASQFKTRFLASMSHEIRTPLNAILGFSRILKSADLSVSQSMEYLDYIESSGSILLKLIGDILDLSKIEEGKLTIQQEKFVFKETIQQLISPYKFKANEKSLEFNLYIDEAIPDMLIGDSYRINQIIINLIANALKFTKEGSISVSFSLSKNKPVDASMIFLQVAVQDTGIGISKEKQALIFDSFMQADNSIVKEFGGSGLGLSIANQLVSLMSGRIHVKSPVSNEPLPGAGGSLFEFEIPLKIDTSVSVKNKKETLAISSFVFDTKISVLVAEDNELNQQLASFMLSKMGCTADIAKNGLEALELLKTNPYDLILMDVQMPLMDGFTATKKIRMELNTSIPIIGLTANVFREDIEDCLNAGMNDHLGKPYNQEQLYCAIEKWYVKKTA